MYKVSKTPRAIYRTNDIATLLFSQVRLIMIFKFYLSREPVAWFEGLFSWNGMKGVQTRVEYKIF